MKLVFKFCTQKLSLKVCDFWMEKLVGTQVREGWIPELLNN